MGVTKGFKKNGKLSTFVDKRLTPPPLSTLVEVNNIHNKEFFHPHFICPYPGKNVGFPFFRFISEYFVFFQIFFI